MGILSRFCRKIFLSPPQEPRPEAEILPLRAHFHEILTLRGIFPSQLSKIAQILTLRAHVPDIRRSDFIAFWSSALKCPKPRQPFHMRVFGHLSKTHGCSLTLASFPLSHDLQKIFWGVQNKPAVFFPQRGRIESFGSDFLRLLGAGRSWNPTKTY